MPGPVTGPADRRLRNTALDNSRFENTSYLIFVELILTRDFSNTRSC